jgi:hypothetical protein
MGGGGVGDGEAHVPPKTISKISVFKNPRKSGPIADLYVGTPLNFLITPISPSKEFVNYWAYTYYDPRIV